MLQQSDESASLKQTVAKLQEEIATLRLERDDHLQQIEDLTNTVEIQKSEMAISEAKMMHLESQLKGNIYGKKFSKSKFLIHKGSYMSAHVLLNLLNESGKRDKNARLTKRIFFFAMSFINSIIQEQEC